MQASWSVEEVVELATRHNLAELEVESGGTRIRVVREHAPAAGPLAQRAELVAARDIERHPATEDLAATANLVPVEAPMVGTFYRAPAPDADPYVEVGSMVEIGQTVCIVEAMKLMNEIESEVRGRVTQILLENAQPVEFGQKLFLIDPA